MTTPITTAIRLIVLISLSAALFACSPKKVPSDDHADQPPTQKTTIKARQDLMHDWKNAFNVIKDMTKNPRQFNAEQFRQKVAIINDSKAQMWRYFDDDTADNRVNDLIHQNPDDFAQMADEFDELIQTLNQAAQNATSSDDVLSATTDVKRSCRSCHEVYKKL